VGSADGDGTAAGDAGGADSVGSVDGVVVGIGVPGAEVPGSGDDAGVDSGTGVAVVGAGETKAMAGVGPAAVVSGDSVPTRPIPSATLASTRLMTPSVRTRRRR
jgi:hypothetical protein